MSMNTMIKIRITHRKKMNIVGSDGKLTGIVPDGQFARIPGA